MRSAWSPTRSMSLQTFFEVLPNRLLALPRLLVKDFTSRSDERGSVIPSTFLRRLRLLSARTPVVAAATASAGPTDLLATSFAVAARPVALRLERASLLLVVRTDPFDGPLLRFALRAPDLAPAATASPVSLTAVPTACRLSWAAEPTACSALCNASITRRVMRRF